MEMVGLFIFISFLSSFLGLPLTDDNEYGKLSLENNLQTSNLRNLESGFFQAAVSANNLVLRNNSKTLGIHSLRKRHSEENLNDDNIMVALQKKVKNPKEHILPAHVLLDSVSVRPHNGNLNFIPPFQLQNATLSHEVTNETEYMNLFKNYNFSKSLDYGNKSQFNLEWAPSSIIKSYLNFPTASTTADKDLNLSSSKQAYEKIEKLKNAEKILKEKVAEIEAEPIILSSRI